MRVALIEPFYAGSHKNFADGLQQHSKHDIDLFTLPGRYWKWRMRGGAITLAKQFLASQANYDILLGTDMVDWATFLALTREKTANLPNAIYFHENQVTYPWSPADKDVAEKRDFHYGLINITSALSADAVMFNSDFHRTSFIKAVPDFLSQFPDHQEEDSGTIIESKSHVAYPGIDLPVERAIHPKNELPVVVWNHRWEYDKNPGDFFRALEACDDHGIDFKLLVLGESFRQQPEEFARAKKRFAHKLQHYGYVDSRQQYLELLGRADVCLVTSEQEFFGISMLEAAAHGAVPLCPRRLTYPELIPAEYHSRLLYQDFNDLVEKLADLLANRKPRGYDNGWMDRYGWRVAAQRIDNLLG